MVDLITIYYVRSDLNSTWPPEPLKGPILFKKKLLSDWKSDMVHVCDCVNVPWMVLYKNVYPNFTWMNDNNWITPNKMFVFIWIRIQDGRFLHDKFLYWPKLKICHHWRKNFKCLLRNHKPLLTQTLHKW